MRWDSLSPLHHSPDCRHLSPPALLLNFAYVLFMWAVLRFDFKSPDRYIMGSEEKTGHVSQWWAHYFHNQNCEEDSFNIMANLWHSWFTRIGFAALHFDQNLGLWRHLRLLSALAPMTTYLFVFLHRSPPLYTWSQNFFGINLQSYIWCLCKFALLSYKQSFLWHIGHWYHHGAHLLKKNIMLTIATILS